MKTIVVIAVLVCSLGIARANIAGDSCNPQLCTQYDLSCTPYPWGPCVLRVVDCSAQCDNSSPAFLTCVLTDDPNNDGTVGTCQGPQCGLGNTVCPTDQVCTYTDNCVTACVDVNGNIIHDDPSGLACEDIGELTEKDGLCFIPARWRLCKSEGGHDPTVVTHTATTTCLALPGEIVHDPGPYVPRCN